MLAPQDTSQPMNRAMYLLHDILNKQIANAATDQRATPLVMPK